eukprot:214966_1
MSLHCNACNKTKKRKYFSKNQFKKYGTNARCKECVKNGIQFTSFQQHMQNAHHFNSIRESSIIPISTIENYPNFRWKIKAICVTKVIEGNSIVVVLMDKYGTEIKTICNNFEFEKKGVYVICHGGPLMSIAADNVSSILGEGDPCIILYEDEPFKSKVIRLDINNKPPEIDHHIQKCEFIAINQINFKSSEKQFVDIRGVIRDVSLIFSKKSDKCTNKNCLECSQKYRSVSIQDKTGTTTITLLGEDANKIELKRFVEFGFDKNKILIITLKRCQKFKDGTLWAVGIVEIETICSDRIDFRDVIRPFCHSYCKPYGKHRRCNTCNRTDIRLKVCKQCQLAYYCNRKCQKRSWNTQHRYYCMSLVQV